MRRFLAIVLLVGGSVLLYQSLHIYGSIVGIGFDENLLWVADRWAKCGGLCVAVGVVLVLHAPTCGGLRISA